jgi:hypothetical protein
MPRFILICSVTKRPYGDTARLDARPEDVTSAAHAACLLDRAKGRAQRGFGQVRLGSPGASLDAYLIEDGVVAHKTDRPNEADMLRLVESKGTFVTSLVGYNS